jgi:hypothetical protein
MVAESRTEDAWSLQIDSVEIVLNEGRASSQVTLEEDVLPFVLVHEPGLWIFEWHRNVALAVSPTRRGCGQEIQILAHNPRVDAMPPADEVNLL